MDMNVPIKLAVTCKVAAAAAAIPDMAEDDPLQIKVQCCMIPSGNKLRKALESSCVSSNFRESESIHRPKVWKNPQIQRTQNFGTCAKAKPAQAPNGNAGAAAQQDGTHDMP